MTNASFQSLLENPQRLYALVLTPTRELAYQISEQFDKLGKEIGVKTVVLVGEVLILTKADTLGLGTLMAAPIVLKCLK